ncbi:MAG: hypothetical protein JKY33_10515 [Bacteroidia bacterium]|nr:hypothetical protein [Bacteroidia bacterium]
MKLINFSESVVIDIDSEIKLWAIQSSYDDEYIAVAKTTNDYWVCYINSSDFCEIPAMDDTEGMELWLKNTGLKIIPLFELLKPYEIWD